MAKKKQKTCPICNKDFYPNHGLQKYCSVDCFRKSKYRKFQKICSLCGKEFLGSASSKYCSQKCMGIDRHKRKPTKCKRCGKEIEVRISQNRRYCTMECARKDMSTGKIKRVQKIKSFDKLWSKIVKAKANNRCELCGVSGDIKQLNAHHIVGRRHLSTRHYIPNGISLCISCHRFDKNSAHENPLWFYDKLVELKGLEFIEHLKQKSREICRWADIREQTAKYLYDEITITKQRAN